MKRYLYITLAFLLIALSGLLFRANYPAKNNSRSLRIMAASDLRQAFPEIAKRFEKETNINVTLVFGSSGQLAEQIKQGGQADVFASASIDYIEDLDKLGFILKETKKVYAIGRIVILVREDSKFVPKKIEDMLDSKIEKIAIANPEHAPYGIAAKEALEYKKVWDNLKDKIVIAENAMQAFQYTKSGNTDAGIVPYAFIQSGEDNYILIPHNYHQPVKQTIAVIKDSNNIKDAKLFMEFVNGDYGQNVLKKYNFELPKEVR